MPRNHDEVDPEAPDESDMDADITDDTQPCPHCRRTINEESEFCPHCGKYISTEDAPIGKSWWIVLTVVACVIVAILWLAEQR